MLELRTVPESVAVDPEVREYPEDVCRASREGERVAIGISPPGLQQLFETSRARAC